MCVYVHMLKCKREYRSFEMKPKRRLWKTARTRAQFASVEIRAADCARGRPLNEKHMHN